MAHNAQKRLVAAIIMACYGTEKGSGLPGRDHWEALLRARAIENRAYVVAPNQWGPHPPGKHCYGHSMIVDPWGTVLCRIPDGPGFAIADVSPARVAELRNKLPALDHRRLSR